MNPVLHSSDHMDWETPWDLIDELEAKYGKFTLDVCATPETSKAPAFYTPEHDGLAQPWHGLCFMNPPYGRAIGKWVAKARSESDAGHADIVGLIPARTDTAYWHDHIEGIAQVTFLRGRVRFIRNGKTGPAPFPSAVIFWEAKA